MNPSDVYKAQIDLIRRSKGQIIRAKEFFLQATCKDPAIVASMNELIDELDQKIDALNDRLTEA